MPEVSVTVVNPLGLHARAAAQLVKLANCFKSSIVIARPDRSAIANGRSILAVLTLYASKGSELIIEVVGEDAESALEALEDLFKNGFGEI